MCEPGKKCDEADAELLDEFAEKVKVPLSLKGSTLLTMNRALSFASKILTKPKDGDTQTIAIHGDPTEVVAAIKAARADLEAAVNASKAKLLDAMLAELLKEKSKGETKADAPSTPAPEPAAATV